MKNYLLSLFTVLALLVTVGNTTLTAQDMPQKNVVELALETEDLSTLAAAVKAAGLVNALTDKDGTYTVFAPTNAAFEALPAGLVDALLMPKNQKVLADILTFHVLDNKVMAADAVAGIKADNSGRFIAPTMNGNLTLMMQGNNVMVKGEQGRVATVTATDVKGTNGVVHIIDKVLLPEGVDVNMLLKNSAMTMKEDKDGVVENVVEGAATGVAKAGKAVGKAVATGAGAVYEGVTEAGEEVVEIFTGDEKDEMADSQTAKPMDRRTNPNYSATINYEGPTLVDVAVESGQFTTLTGALTKAGLAETLATTGMYTVFAPTDDAFNALPDGTVASLSNDQLTNVLKYHVIPARISATELIGAINAYKGGYYRLQTITGESLFAYLDNGQVKIVDGQGNVSTVVRTDVNASNGTVHAVDSVLMPRM